MDQVKKTIHGFLIGIGVYAIVMEIVGVFLSKDLFAYTAGLVLGIMVAIFLLIHMAKTLDRVLDLSKGEATKKNRLYWFIRFIVMLVALVIGLSVKSINFIAVIIGLMGLKVGALIAPFFLKRIYPENFVTPLEDEEPKESSRENE